MEGVARAERRRSSDVISADIAVSQAGVIIGGGMRTTARVRRGGHGRQARVGGATAPTAPLPWSSPNGSPAAITSDDDQGSHTTTPVRTPIAMNMTGPSAAAWARHRRAPIGARTTITPSWERYGISQPLPTARSRTQPDASDPASGRCSRWSEDISAASGRCWVRTRLSRRFYRHLRYIA
jgi:hypothetical protein